MKKCESLKLREPERGKKDMSRVARYSITNLQNPQQNSLIVPENLE